MKRRRAIDIEGLNSCSLEQQQLDDIGVTALTRVMQRRALLVETRDIGSRANQQRFDTLGLIGRDGLEERLHLGRIIGRRRPGGSRCWCDTNGVHYEEVDGDTSEWLRGIVRIAR